MAGQQLRKLFAVAGVYSAGRRIVVVTESVVAIKMFDKFGSIYFCNDQRVGAKREMKNEFCDMWTKEEQPHENNSEGDGVVASPH